MAEFDVYEGDINEGSRGRARTRPWQPEARVMYFDKAILLEAGFWWRLAGLIVCLALFLMTLCRAFLTA